MMTPAEEALGKKYDELASLSLFDGAGLPALEQIGDRSYLELPALGLSLVLNEELTVIAVHLHGAGHEGHQAFVGDLPARLDFSLARDDVRKKLGSPASFSDGSVVPVLGRKPAWDNFTLGERKLHIEYREGNTSVLMITIS